VEKKPEEFWDGSLSMPISKKFFFIPGIGTNNGTTHNGKYYSNS
jgi:hypothetical protein